jgi:hypothetical protein
MAFVCDGSRRMCVCDSNPRAEERLMKLKRRDTTGANGAKIAPAMTSQRALV